MKIRTQKFSRRQYIIGVIVLILLIIVVERLITQGTFLGYTVRETNKSALLETKEQESQACKDLTEKEVSDVVKSSVKRIATNLGDQKSPLLLSTCSYKSTDDSKRSVTVVARELASEDSAKRQLELYKKRSESQPVNIGDEAYFVVPSRQLALRQGSKIITVSLSSSVEQTGINLKDAAVKLAQQLL